MLASGISECSWCFRRRNSDKIREIVFVFWSLLRPSVDANFSLAPIDFLPVVGKNIHHRVYRLPNESSTDEILHLARPGIKIHLNNSSPTVVKMLSRREMEHPLTQPHLLPISPDDDFRPGTEKGRRSYLNILQVTIGMSLGV
jgi:hypothetical protein